MNCKKCKKPIDSDSIYCKWCGVAQKRDKKKAMYQRPDGLFEKAMTINGKRETFRAKSEPEVYRKIAAYEEKQETGRTFEEVAEEWKVEAWGRISPNSCRNYAKPYERAVGRFGSKSVQKISSNDIRSFIYEIVRQGYAQKTVLAHRMVLNQIFELALISGEVLVNPVTCVKLPKNLPKTQRTAPTEEQLTTIKGSSSAPFGLFPLFVLCTGCRLGEALAVTGNDIDYENRTLRICRSLYWLSAAPNFKSTKTEAGQRVVPIPDIVFDVLPKISKSEYLFCGDIPFKKQQYNNQLAAYQNATGLKLTAHQLRHGYATLLYEAGVDLKDAQYLLGHKSISMTMDVYTHLSNTKKERTATTFNDFLNKNTQSTE